MDVCGLNNITWGPHQTHMYGVFDIGGNKLGLDFLKNEYGQMMKKYRSGRFRYLAIRILEITGLKEIIKRMVPGLRPTFQKPEDI